MTCYPHGLVPLYPFFRVAPHPPIHSSFLNMFLCSLVIVITSLLAGLSLSDALPVNALTPQYGTPQAQVCADKQPGPCICNGLRSIRLPSQYLDCGTESLQFMDPSDERNINIDLVSHRFTGDDVNM
jgi:hypothetical protein